MQGKERKYLRDLVEGEEFELAISVKQKRPPRPYCGGQFFELRVSDKSGEMTLKYWGKEGQGSVEEVYSRFEVGDVVAVKGCLVRYRDQMEVSVSIDKGGSIVRVPLEQVAKEDFVMRSSVDPEKLVSELISYARSVKQKDLAALLAVFFSDEDFMERFSSAPGSMWMHCNWIGGLAEHTLKVVETCEYLSKQYPKLDQDLLITGALLHDIGKIGEYSVTTNIDVTDDGMLRGHIAIGMEMVARACDKVPEMDRNIRLKVEHMILSSHGELEYGSPKRPQFPEAFALYYADDLDAKLEQFIKVKEEARTEDPWIYHKKLGQVYLR